MSYAKFLNDLNAFYKEDANKGIHYETAWGIVRDTWIKDGRLEELVKFLLTNWNEGNCDQFIAPIERHLKVTRNQELFVKMWRGILKNRLNTWRIRRTETKKRFVLDGILRFKNSLEYFGAFDEIERLDMLLEGINSNLKVKYP
jgi:hypothetical protein